MPGRFDSWHDFQEQAARVRIAAVVCLTPMDEVQEFSPAYAKAISKAATSWTWTHLPIPNFGVPQDRAAFREGVLRIADALRRGDALLMHCAAGLGRTGSTAACVLKALGLPTSEALQRVRDAGSNPQNAAQSGFVDWF